jgi:hypothetical protein
MRVIASTETKAHDKWRQGEHQALIKHFEEIYKLGATSITVVIAACGAVLAYAGVTPVNLLAACLLIILWFLAFMMPLQRYTLHVVGRLAAIEDDARRRGHFHGWKALVDADKRGIATTGTLFWKVFAWVVVLGAFVCVGYMLFVGWEFSRPIEVTVATKAGQIDIQLKATARENELKARTESLLKHAQALNAGAAAAPVPSASPSTPTPTAPLKP